MARKGLKFLLAYICVVTLIRADINQEHKEPYIDPEWRKPDAWSRHREQVALEEKLRNEENGENSLVVQRESCVKDEHTIDISKTFYMRLAKILFNDQKFKVTFIKYGSKKVILNNLYYRRENQVSKYGQSSSNWKKIVYS